MCAIVTFLVHMVDLRFQFANIWLISNIIHDIVNLLDAKQREYMRRKMWTWCCHLQTTVMTPLLFPFVCCHK